jgi:hypothetical protein
MALVLAGGFAAIYVPVIASEERFLRATFPEFESYCHRVPRLLPCFQSTKHPANLSGAETGAGSFSFSLYLQHREYNAGIGAALLYLSLFLLRSTLAVLGFFGPR